ncbi:MAG: TIGR02680 family protein [Sciscionella sp.]
MTERETAQVDAGEWLSAAITGGLPEPTRERWQPLRVGIVNLWEYDETEFWFADGRLVLRGGNGAGKTKVLELTTLMLLRGEVSASVLDPFGSQHRTMRFNLLPTGEGDDPREPADSGLGYAWVEFGYRTADGEPEYFTCGMGASARRGTGTGGVNTWHFVTRLRPGKALTLSTADRPIDLKELRKLDGVEIPATATAYRSRLATALFGLEPDAYDNLTELLKQLRKPKLGERLNPASLADTLRDALPPLAAGEVTQLADGWDHLEQLRQAVEQTEHAATAVATFVRGGWRPWARVALKRRADAFTEATTALDQTTRDKRAAEAALVTAETAVRDTATKLAETRQRKQDSDAALRELLDSQAYQDAVSSASRVESLRDSVKTLGSPHQAANKRLATAAEAVDVATRKVASAEAQERRAADTVSGDDSNLRTHAEAAGLLASAERHLPAHDVDALLADHGNRTERFRHLRELHGRHATAARAADRSEYTVTGKERDLASATEDESKAASAVETAVDTVREQIRDWAGTVTVARCSAEQVESWCDLVAELTVIDTDAGAPTGGRSATEALRAHIAAVRDRLAQQRHDLQLRRAPLVERRITTEKQLTEVREQADAPPPLPELWRRRQRPEPDSGIGAPLWRCVQPSEGASSDTLATLEAALAAAGLLDSWLSPTGQLSTVDGAEINDVHLLTGEAITGSTLAAVLEPTPSGGVPAAIVHSVLGSIGWYGQRPSHDTGTWLAEDGSWRLGRLTGRAEPLRPVSLLGATAREAARQREISRLAQELDEVNGRIGLLDGELTVLAERASSLHRENEAVPSDRPVADAVITLAERGRRRTECDVALAQAQAEHDDNLRRRDEAWAAFAEYAGQHAFPLRNLDAVGAALQEYRSALATLRGDLAVLAAKHDAVAESITTLAGCERLRETAERELSDLDGQLRAARVRLRTAEQALRSDHAQQLRRRQELDDTVSQLATRIDMLGDDHGEAKAAQAKAEHVLDQHEEHRAGAERQRDAMLTALWSTVDAGLAGPLGVAEPQRRTVEQGQQFARAARREITVTADQAAEDRTWRRCYAAMKEMTNALLPNRDARVAEETDGGDLPRVLVLTEQAAGWQPPQQAADALAERVREQRENYDAEQQRVLTTLLGSTFIEHLKDRLDYTARTFAGINEQLARHPTRYGHTVRLRWEASPADPDAGAVVTALAQGYQQLGAQRQEMVRSFLARKIDEARGDAAAEGIADWKERLATALDYRRWLRISLQYRSGSGSGWSPFDSAKHAAKSGGEKVVLLSQPLFAAAVVAYDAAAAQAPRWVWLDEAMTGVDAGIKASFMGLTVAFDLDVMLTAHDEWCNYPTVPAVAVYDLAREQHLAGVDVLPYLWCGGDLTKVEVDRLGLSHREDPLAAEGLFASDGTDD